MFTGIIEAVVEVSALEEGGGRRRLWLDLTPLSEFDVTPGASVAVDGACLTAVEIRGKEAAFDVVAETLRRTTLGTLKVGSRVNVERALRAGGRLGGHFVQGHVDGVGVVERLEPRTGETILRVRAPDLVEGLVPKGSVAVAGVSLTVADLFPEGFTVALVPFTLRETTLGGLRPGEAVNIETDLIGKYVRSHLARAAGSGGLTAEFLEEHGFT